MSELLKIAAEKRSQTGKGYARKLRAAGKIPANIIGKGQTQMIELDPKLLPKVWKSGKKFDLELDGATKTVEIKEVQFHAVKRYAQHVDLMYV